MSELSFSRERADVRTYADGDWSKNLLSLDQLHI